MGRDCRNCVPANSTPVVIVGQQGTHKTRVGDRGRHRPFVLSFDATPDPQAQLAGGRLHAIGRVEQYRQSNSSENADTFHSPVGPPPTTTKDSSCLRSSEQSLRERDSRVGWGGVWAGKRVGKRAGPLRTKGACAEVPTWPRESAGQAPPSAHRTTAHQRAHRTTAHPRAHRTTAHPRAHRTTAHPRAHRTTAHQRAHRTTAHPRAHRTTAHLVLWLES